MARFEVVTKREHRDKVAYVTYDPQDKGYFIFEVYLKDSDSKIPLAVDGLNRELRRSLDLFDASSEWIDWSYNLPLVRTLRKLELSVYSPKTQRVAMRA